MVGWAGQLHRLQDEAVFPAKILQYSSRSRLPQYVAVFCSASLDAALAEN